MTDLKTIIRKRGAIKAKVTLFKGFLNTTKEKLKNADLPELERSLLLKELQNRLNKLSVTEDEFNEVQCEIEIKCEKLEDQIGEREEFDNDYFRLQAEASQILEEPQSHTTNSPEGSITTSNVSNSQNFKQSLLPDIKLPNFNGSFENWLEFRDTFTSLIHDNQELSDLHKFHYLRSSLIDNAVGALRSIPFTAENYQLTWNHICQRFNNTSLIVLNHIKTIFNLPILQKESFTELNNFLDEANKHLESWASIQTPQEQFDSLIIHTLAAKLDKTTRFKWDESKSTTELPTLTQFIEFLKTRADKLYTREVNSIKIEPKSVGKMHSKSFITVEKTCELCKEAHKIYQCQQFIAKKPAERQVCIKQLNLCMNCFKAGHVANKCYSGNCRKCKKRHNTMLHVEETTNSSNKTKTMNETVNVQAVSKSSHILLATALIKVKDANGVWQAGRALLDSGSQSNFITQDFAKRIKHKTNQINHIISGISQRKAVVNQMMTLQIHSITETFSETLEFLIIPDITCKLPATPIAREELNLPNLPLADEQFHKPGEIDMLIGAGTYFELIQNQQIKLGINQPILQKTNLGWIISGAISASTRAQTNMVHTLHVTTHDALEETIKQFWKIEELPTIKYLSKEEEACENHFTLTHSREADGRFVVKFPFKQDATVLGDSREMATKRFQAVENKFRKDDELKQQYISFMREYEELGHMSKNDEDIEKVGNYLPHHAVFKQNITSKKIRVVFDASAKTSSGKSLNNILMVGPTIQQTLFSIIVRFRQHRYVFTGDIIKMYRQILMHDSDKKLQLILWRESEDQPMVTYQLNTITYGTSSAPFLAVRCLHQLAYQNVETHPDVSRVILEDFYMDDVLTGGDSLDYVIQLKENLIEELDKGGFSTDKWMSNAIELLNTETPSESLELFKNPEGVVKTLGLVWNPQTDTIQYKISPLNNIAMTKRQILAEIAKLFDPLGLLGPIIVTAKMLMQKLWQLKIDWDERVPNHLESEWQIFKSKLGVINSIQIPRYVREDNAVEIQLHGFADSSEKAYGAVISIRTIDDQKMSNTKLLCSKSKVAPLKKQSLPRLELCAALLLAQLYSTVITTLNLKFERVVFWSDSSIVLHWIHTEPHLLKTFVANRVSKIQSLTEISSWRHVNSAQNPADILSRGVLPNEIEHQNMWWHGPQFLNLSEEAWPSPILNLPIDKQRHSVEFKTAITCHVTTENCEIFEKFSSFTRLVRVTAFCMRFINNCRKKKLDAKVTGPLMPWEIQESIISLVRLAQQQQFARELLEIKRTGVVQTSSTLKSLHPFIDESHIIRVGGRLKIANLDYDQKHPILLPKSHKLTNLIIEDEHRRALHAGAQVVLSRVRLKFWPIAAKNSVKKIVRSCVVCAKARPRPITNLMGDLPTARVIPAKPFTTTGVDFCGPFLTKEFRRRGKSSIKIYIAVFVCFTTRAIHLEFVTDLSSKAFIAALQRFISRRGRCNHIYCDNGTNFVGAKNEFQQLLSSKLNQEEIQNEFSMDNLTFHFIPPRSPHMGGLWEAAVKSHLKRIAANANLTYEEFITLITRIESCLNSRPLMTVSDDPHDPLVLTPAHFLMSHDPNVLPEQPLTTCDENRLTHWQRVQALFQHFWKRWSREYLMHLQTRVRWQLMRSGPKIGDIVLLIEPTPPSTWRMGRIQEVHPGSDGVIRVVSVKTKSGVVKRACAKVCLLPVSTENP